MRLGARPVRRAAQRDTCVSGKRCNAAGRVPRRTEGREKFATGCVAIRLWYTYHGANRSCPVANFSPVKQVNINDPWYKSVMNLIIHPDLRAEWNRRLMRCAVGRSGFSTTKREGDGVTPVGDFPVREAFYRADRMARPPTKLPCRPLIDTDGWCDDPADPRYNRTITLPYAASHEKLMRHDGLYDLVVVLGYNDDPVIAGLGSAIFLHVAAPDFASTEGCVALALTDLQAVVAALQPGDKIRILPVGST